MTSYERMMQSVNHKEPDKVPIDIGATNVTGMHASCVAELRDYFGLEKRPVIIHDPFQCLGFIDEDLAEAIGTDAAKMGSRYTFFGFPNENWKEWRTPWGQDVLVAEKFNVTEDEESKIYMYPQGNTSYPPSAVLPEGGYFFDEIIRQEPLPLDDSEIKAEDNLEEFQLLSDVELMRLAQNAELARDSGKFVIADFGGLGLGDIACIPAPQIPYPKGIRDVTEWYVSTVIRQPLLNEIFEKQYDIGMQNLKKINDQFGDKIDGLFLCGTDFGTQDSSFCSPETFKSLYMPHYKKITEWIHNNTEWKIFKHSCGSIPEFIPLLIEAGFDILNPVQISAKGMDPQFLKKEFGEDITFWGGGIDTQHTLPFGSPEDVRREVLENLRIFSADGGYVFNPIHNVQAKTPIKNLIAMFDAYKEYNGIK